jgi:hypothetical protein
MSNTIMPPDVSFQALHCTPDADIFAAVQELPTLPYQLHSWRVNDAAHHLLGYAQQTSEVGFMS